MYRIRDHLTYPNVMVTLVALVVVGVAAYLVFADDDGGGSSYVVGSTVNPGIQSREPWLLVGAASESSFAKSSTQQGCRWGNRDRRQRSAAAFTGTPTASFTFAGRLLPEGPALGARNCRRSSSSRRGIDPGLG